MLAVSACSQNVDASWRLGFGDHESAVGREELGGELVAADGFRPTAGGPPLYAGIH